MTNSHSGLLFLGHPVGKGHCVLVVLFVAELLIGYKQGHREFPNGNSRESRCVQIPAGIPGNFRLSTLF